MRTMRKIGYVLLIGGFLILVASAAMSKQFAFVVIWAQSEKLPKQETFTRKQMDDAIHEAVFQMRQPLAIAVPAVVMLCGGILLDRTKRRKNESNQDG